MVTKFLGLGLLTLEEFGRSIGIPPFL